MKRYKNLISKFRFNKQQKDWIKISFDNFINQRISIKELILQIWTIFRHKRIYFEDEIQIINKKKKNTLYIIRRTPPGSGLFSNFHLALGHIIFANFNKFEYFIDYENYSNFYKEKKTINGEKNSWNYYFTQPLSKRKIIKKNYGTVIYSSNSKRGNISSNQGILDSQSLEVLLNKEQLEIYQNAFKQNIDFNETTLNYFKKTRKKIFKDNTKILGVSIRGTDYVVNKYPGHYIPPTIFELISQIDIFLEKYNPSRIFASTEDTEYLKLLIEKYGERLIHLEKDRYSPGEIPMYKIEENKNYKNGLDYLTEIWLLSQCDFIIGSPNGGFNGAFILKENSFNDSYIFDLGKYPDSSDQIV